MLRRSGESGLDALGNVSWDDIPGVQGVNEVMSELQCFSVMNLDCNLGNK